MASNSHGNQTKITAYFDPDLLAQLDAAADQERRSRNNLITVAVQEYLTTHHTTRHRR